jgi:hypothetical protein
MAALPADDNGGMWPIPLAELLSETSPVFGIMIVGGFLVGVYAQAARMPRLLAAAIAVVMFGTLLLIIQAQSAGEFSRFTG